jgi:hypothetical protein
MPSVFVYGLLAAVGLTVGYVNHRLSMWAGSRSSRWRRYLSVRVVDGLGAIPGALLVLPLADIEPGSSYFENLLRPSAAYFLPYLVARVITHDLLSTRRGHREHSLPFEYWYGLLLSDPAAAREFIAAFFSRLDAERRSLSKGAPVEIAVIDQLRATTERQIIELEAGFAQLEEGHANDPRLPAALATLRAQIERLKHDRD